MNLSIVTTLYRSEPYIGDFYRRISAAAKQLTDKYELIFVNDGSPDHSLDVVLSLAAGDPRIVVIDLSRNFGHHKAIMTGLARAQGERVFLIDSDLEEDPELLIEFSNHMQLTHADVVFGVQKHRAGSLFRRLTGSAFYKLFALLSDLRVPPQSTDGQANVGPLCAESPAPYGAGVCAFGHLATDRLRPGTCDRDEKGQGKHYLLDRQAGVDARKYY